MGVELSEYGVFLPQTPGVDVGIGGTDTYMVSFPWVLKTVACPVDRCPARAYNLRRILEYFMYWHWKSKVVIIKEGP